MQMNLCLSGRAGCYAKVDYPAGVEDAAARIRRAHPDAVTLNETCSGDVAVIARRTGYHVRFSTVIYGGEPLRCIHPRGRGIFGDAVLIKNAIESSDSQAFATQAGPERRVWLCVTARGGVEVCTAHLASHERAEVAANDPQCAELSALLARRAAREVIFAGDVNHRASCAPRGFWTRTDRSARQNPGDQHVYGTVAFRSPVARVTPATHTDHDTLLVMAYLTTKR
jgi:endonuclease/exonuclease/phosphatase family metal-dependent hydrolase